MKIPFLLSEDWSVEYQETLVNYGKKLLASSPHGVVFLVSPRPGKLNLLYEVPPNPTTIKTILEIK